MSILDEKTNRELYDSLLAEIAKASNEIRSAEADVRKAQNRLKFAILLANTLIERTEDR